MSRGLFELSRNFTSSRALLGTMSEPLSASVASHYEDSLKLWRKLFFIVCVPSIILCTLNVAFMEEEKRPEFKKYSFLRIRKKKYPWRDGVKTLFHHPHNNALPDGYEDELHN